MPLECFTGRCVSTCENEWFWNLIAVSKLERAEKKTDSDKLTSKVGYYARQEYRQKEQASHWTKKNDPKNWLTDEYLKRIAVNLDVPWKKSTLVAKKNEPNVYWLCTMKRTQAHAKRKPKPTGAKLGHIQGYAMWNGPMCKHEYTNGTLITHKRIVHHNQHETNECSRTMTPKK